MKKHILSILLVLSIAASAAACNSSTGSGGNSGTSSVSGKSNAQQKQPVEVVYWDENAGPSRTPYHEEMIRKFNESQNEVKVVYEGLPWESAKQKFDIAIATGDVPDITNCAPAWGADFLAQKALLPLDSYFNSWSEKDNINKQYIELNRGLDSQGRLFMIPYTVATPIMWVREDWFKEANLDLPTTWDKFFTAAEKLTDPSKNRYGFSIRGGSGSVVDFQHAMYAYSGIPSYFDENGNCTVNSPDHVEFMERIMKLYKKYTPESDITNGYKEMVAGFDGGTVAMIFHNVGSYSEHSSALKDGQYKAMPFPKSKRNTYSFTAGSQGGYAIFAKSKVPDAAWKYVSFLAGEEMNSYWNQKIGQIPLNNKVVNHEWIKNAPHLQTAMQTLSDPNCKLVSQPKFLPDYSRIIEKDSPPNFQAVMAGEKTAKQMLDAWANSFTEAYKQYNSKK